jgi:hypothetical protein
MDRSLVSEQKQGVKQGAKKTRLCVRALCVALCFSHETTTNNPHALHSRLYSFLIMKCQVAFFFLIFLCLCLLECVVVAAVTPSSNVQCSDVKTLATTRIVFSKLHKVGSTSIKETLLTLFEPPASWWTCPFDPYSHEFMTEVHGLRMAEILPQCVKRDQDSGEILPVETMIVLRDPIERLVSSWLFTLGNYIFQMRNLPSAVKDTNLVVAAKIMNASMPTITRDELAHFHSLNKYTYAYTTFLAGTPNYRRVKLANRTVKQARKKRRSEDTATPQELLPAAMKVLREDYSLPCTTERLPSLFTLLACRHGLNLSATCDKFITRNTGQRNNKYFGTAERPPADVLFNQEAFAYLQEIVQPDMVLWQMARSRHEQQLAEAGHTVESATEAWRRHCAGGFTKKSSSFVRTVMN